MMNNTGRPEGLKYYNGNSGISELARLGNKEVGTEPGYIARKCFNKEVLEKNLKNKNHHTYKVIDKLLKESNRNTILNKIIEKAGETLKNFYQQPQQEQEQKNFQKLIEKHKTNLQNEDLPQKPSAINPNSALFNVISLFVQHCDRSYLKNHYIKGTYEKSPLFGRVYRKYSEHSPLLSLTIPFFGINLFGWTRVFSFVWRQHSQHDANFSVVREALVNDLYNAANVKGQKLRIRKETYSDKTPRLILDGTEIRGGEDQKKPFSTLRNHIHNGKIQAWDEETNRWKENHVKIGENFYPVDEQSLSSLKIKALFFGDRDKVGPHGDNLGFVIENDKAVIYNIDPGKAFSDLDFAKNTSFTTNFSTPEPKPQNILDRLFPWRIQYRQFSIFKTSDTEICMQGVYDLLAAEKSHRSIISEYKNKFSSSNSDGLNFSRELNDIENTYNDQMKKLKNAYASKILNPDTLLPLLNKKRGGDWSLDLNGDIYTLTRSSASSNPNAFQGTKDECLRHIATLLSNANGA